ncbi:hypothetical protein EsH8_VII_000427 [Colletotrichum jinshuiense]
MYNHVPAYGMHSYSAQRPQSYFGGQGYQPYGLQHDPRNPFTGAYQVPPPHLTPYMWSAPPPPPPPPTHVQEYKTPAPPEPAPPVEVVESKREKELDPELEKLKQELERRRKEQAMKEEEKRKEEMEARLQKQAEEAIAKRMDDMKRAQAEAQVQIEKAKEEAAMATRAAIEAEKKAEEQKELLFQEALRKAEQEAREKVEAEAQRRLLNEEMQHRAFLEAKEKLAKEAEERRLQQEEEDEKRKQLLQDLRDEIRAEILAEGSGALGSPRSTNRAMHSSRVTYQFGVMIGPCPEEMRLIGLMRRPIGLRDRANQQGLYKHQTLEIRTLTTIYKAGLMHFWVNLGFLNLRDLMIEVGQHDQDQSVTDHGLSIPTSGPGFNSRMPKMTARKVQRSSHHQRIGQTLDLVEVDLQNREIPDLRKGTLPHAMRIVAMKPQTLECQV